MSRRSLSKFVPILQLAMALGVWRSPGGEYHFVTPDEQANAKVALRFLRTRAGSWVALAKMTSVTVATLRYTASMRGEVGADIALEIARLAGVPVEEILTGAWPKDGACPYCGAVSR